MVWVVRVNDVLDGQVDLDVACLDRIYLNGMCEPAGGGQAVSFLTPHSGNRSRHCDRGEDRYRFRKAGDRSYRQPHPGCAVSMNDRKIDRMRP